MLKAFIAIASAVLLAASSTFAQTTPIPSSPPPATSVSETPLKFPIHLDEDRKASKRKIATMTCQVTKKGSVKNCMVSWSSPPIDYTIKSILNGPDIAQGKSSGRGWLEPSAATSTAVGDIAAAPPSAVAPRAQPSPPSASPRE